MQLQCGLQLSFLATSRLGWLERGLAFGRAPDAIGCVWCC